MAPETNIGSSTPISSTGANIGSDLRRKEINDAAASLRGLAASHGRNSALGKRSGARRLEPHRRRGAAPARHRPGRADPAGAARPRSTGGSTLARPPPAAHRGCDLVTEVDPGFLVGFLSTLLDPNIVSLLFLAGIVGIGFEIFHPGVVLPGAIGAISLLLSLFGLSVLSVSTTGLLLVGLGVALLVLDAHAPTHGALTLAGPRRDGVRPRESLPRHPRALPHLDPADRRPLPCCSPAPGRSRWRKAVAARRLPVSVGPEEIVGMQGIVDEAGPRLRQRRALAGAASAEPLAPGQRVQVEALEGLTLRVHRLLSGGRLPALAAARRL